LSFLGVFFVHFSEFLNKHTGFKIALRGLTPAPPTLMCLPAVHARKVNSVTLRHSSVSARADLHHEITPELPSTAHCTEATPLCRKPNEVHQEANAIPSKDTEPFNHLNETTPPHVSPFRVKEGEEGSGFGRPLCDCVCASMAAPEVTHPLRTPQPLKRGRHGSHLPLHYPPHHAFNDYGTSGL
jgi:hypothetical protein